MRHCRSNTLLTERRKLLHQRTAQTIEELFSDRLEDHLTELAHHFDRSGNVRYALRDYNKVSDGLYLQQLRTLLNE